MLTHGMGSTPPPPTMVDTFGTHPLSSRFSVGRIPRHSALSDVVRLGLSAAGIPSMLEPSGLDAATESDQME